MNLTNEEVWHIANILKERGFGHCQFCKNLLTKLEDWLEATDKPSKENQNA